MFLLLLVLVCCTAHECESNDADDSDFEARLAQFRALADAALDRGLARRESIAELSETDVGRDSLFHDVYPVVFQRAALERKSKE